MDKDNNIQPTVIDRAGRGDKDAQAWLYHRYSKAMYNVCMRMAGNRNDAEDILQESFMLAFKNLRQLKDPGNFGGWLRRIVTNECIRRSKRSFRMIDLEEHHYEEIAEEIAEWWTELSMDQVHHEIKNLPEGCRQVFVLYAMEDYSHKSIAESLAISEGTSKSQYHRARQLLRERIFKQMEKNG